MNIFEFLFLISAHFLGDFSFQNIWMVERKWKDPFVLIAHCFIWTGTLSVVLICFNDFALWKFIFLFLGHLACDSLKHKGFDKLPTFLKNSIDQGFHLFQALLVCIL